MIFFSSLISPPAISSKGLKNIFYVSCYTMTISVVRVLSRCSTIKYFLLDTHISSILVSERDKLWTFFKELWLLCKFDVNCRLIWFGERGGEHMKISKSWQNVTACARVFNLFWEHYECVHVFLDNDSGDDWVTIMTTDKISCVYLPINGITMRRQSSDWWLLMMINKCWYLFPIPLSLSLHIIINTFI